MIRKAYTILVIMLVAICSTYAKTVYLQKLPSFDDRLLHFGFTLGINAMDANITNYNSVADNPKQTGNLPTDNGLPTNEVRATLAEIKPGFTVGGLVNLRVSNSADFRFLSGISIGERTLKYNIPVATAEQIITSQTQQTYTISSTYLDFAFLMKYKAKRIVNQRPYLIGGLAYRRDISKPPPGNLVNLKRDNAFLELGVGWDTYLTFFRISTELKFSLGLLDQLAAAPLPPENQYYQTSIKRFRTNMVTLSFHFE